MTTEELNNLYAEIMKSRMGVNPYVSLGANVGGNLISALVANQARRRAQERLSGLQRPSLPAFRQNPLLSQRIAQQQQLADQPMMGYQRAADEQTARQMERGRQIAAGLGGGAGLAYMQGVSSNAAAQQRQGLLTDMNMQARNRAELDQLINMRNQEMQQQRNLEAMDYQLGLQDYARQREGLEADVAQQGSNISAAIGSSVADIPQYIQNFRMYNAMRDLTPRDAETIAPMTPIGTPGSVGSPVPNPLMDASPSYTATPLLTRNEMTYAPPRPAMDMLPAMPIERPDPYSSYIPSRLLSQQAASVQPQPAPIQRAVNPFEAAMMSRLGLPGFDGGPSYIDEAQGQSLGGGKTMRQGIMRAPSLRSRQIAGPSPYYVMRHPIYDESLRLNFYPSGYYGR
jgi:hypothetical protein